MSGKLLAEIVRNLPPQTVEVSTDGAKVVVSCGSAKFTILTLPVEDYPTLPAMPALTGSVLSDTFAAAVSQVAVAAGRDDTLPMLTGVRIEIEGSTVTLVSTDRYRLAVRELTWTPEDPNVSAVALVPAKTLADTAKSLTGGAQISIALSTAENGGEGMIGFEGGGRRTTTRLLEGEFPKYRNSPGVLQLGGEVQKNEFIETVKRVSLVAEHNRRCAAVLHQRPPGARKPAPEKKPAVEELSATLEGDDIQIAFNSTFLLDCGLTRSIRRGHTCSSRPPPNRHHHPAGPQTTAPPRLPVLIMPVRISN